jgi:hypothetical protein
MASTSLTRTFSAGNRKTYTFSAWCKFSDTTGSSTLFHANIWSATPWGLIQRQSDNTINFRDYGGSDFNIVTNRLFRDTSAWYHVVVAVDTTQATASNRVKFYINGVQETSFSLANYPTLNHDTAFNNTVQHQVGHEGGIGNYFNGSMSHINFIDGTAYDATAFGEYDANGVWTINTSPSVTYGTNGFFILKDGNSVTDQSPNTNNFTVGGGTLTILKIIQVNVFATLSPHILPRNSGGTISNGNLFFGTSAAQWTTESSAFGIANGKYYFEVKLKDNGSDRRFRWGLQKNAEITKTGNNKVIGGADNNAIGYKTQGESATQGGYFINQTETNLTDGDINEDNAIYGFAIDLDNQRMYGHFNGTWLHSGNPSAGTGGIDVSSFYTVGEPLFPSFTTHNSNIEINFGNGYFGTTAVASAGTNASGIGIFEYDVPTGYTALCTKGLNL